MKKWMKIVLGIVVVLVLAVAAVWLMMDSLAKTAIEKGATYALGVDTRVDSVSLRLLRGEVVIQGITVSNPPDFQTPHLMQTGRLELAVQPGSLLGDTVVVNRFEIDGLDMHIEQKIGSSNVSVLLDNIKKKAAETPTKEPKEGKEPGGKKVKVDRIVIRNVVAHVQVLPIGGKATTLDVKVPEITMNNVTSDNAGGVAIGELTKRLVPAILAAVVDKGKGILPDGDLKKLGDDVASTTAALGQGAANLVKQAGGDTGKLLQGLGQGAKETGEAVKKGVGGVLENLLGGKKKPDAPDKAP